MSNLKESILIDVKEIIAKIGGLTSSEITIVTNPSNDLGFDSLDMVELLMEIEIEYRINIEEMEWEGIKTVNDIVELVMEKTKHE